MSASLVGSEMCIRDREPADEHPVERQRGAGRGVEEDPADGLAEQHGAALEVHVAPAPATPAVGG
eukprot:14136408-Alexandrium_andersonii.AAC.1